jgi:hypothetical protein
MMVCVPQGFDIGLCENPAMLMLWLTQLAGRPIAISLDASRTTTPHEDFVRLIQEVALMASLSNPEVRPLLDDRLMAILKLDFGIYNIGNWSIL